VVAAEQLDSKAAYVACSGGRNRARIFTPEKEHLLEDLKRTSDRLAASDVIGTSHRISWRVGAMGIMMDYRRAEKPRRR
jgi:hypothetical protein